MNDELFWSKVDRRGDDDCWEWLAYKSNMGYGRLNEKGTVWLAHRWAYRMTYGDFNLKLSVCHKCDNPGCVNPRHLWLGTHLENVQDMVKKGRHQPGERKVSKVQDDEIRCAVAAGKKKKDIAAQYGVSPSLITHILRGRCHGKAA